MSADLLVGHAFKRLVSETPYLVEDTAVAPDITGGGVLAEDESLWSCPLERDLPSLRHVVVIFNQVPSHTKVTYLQLLKVVLSHDFVSYYSLSKHLLLFDTGRGMAV